jgi:hypothetical protein
VPQPQPEGTVRVVLSSATYEEPAGFRAYAEYPVIPESYRVFDVPAELYGQWVAAQAAFDLMQEKIEELMRHQARDPLPVPSPGLPH